MNSMNSLDTRSVSMLACLWMEGLGALASWISAGKIRGTTHQFFYTVRWIHKGFIISSQFFFSCADNWSFISPVLPGKCWMLLNTAIILTHNSRKTELSHWSGTLRATPPVTLMAFFYLKWLQHGAAFGFLTLPFPGQISPFKVSRWDSVDS